MLPFDPLSTVTTEQLERGFREISDDELSFITILGGVLGVVWGTVLVGPLPSMLALLGLAVAMTFVNAAADPLMRSRRWPKRRAAAAAQSGADGARTDASP